MFFCRSLIVDAESDGVLSSSFANFTFDLYCFGSDLNVTSYGFLGLGCWGLSKIFFM